MMKHLSVLVLLIVLCCMVFTSCGKENIPDAQNSTSAASGETALSSDTASSSQTPSSDDTLVSEDYFTPTEDPIKYGYNGVYMWLEDKYGNKIKDAVVQYASSASFDQLSDSFNVNPILYTVSFTSQEAISNAEKQPDGSYMIKVLAVMVIKSNKALLIGVLGPGEFTENDAIISAYVLISKNNLYSPDLKPFQKYDLPSEFSQIDLGLISGGRYTIGRYTCILPGNILAAACLKNKASGDKHDTGIALYNLSERKLISYVEIGDYDIADMKVIDGNLIIQAMDNNFKDCIFKVDSKGNLTTEEYLNNKDHLIYSPDGSKYAYSLKGSIYAADVNDNNPKLLIAGKYTGVKDVVYYYPFAWYDNSTLVYGIGGYELSYGCGVIDADTGKNTFFEQLKGSYPTALKNGKFYTIAAQDMELYFDPYVIDLSDKVYAMRKLFKDRAFVENVGHCTYSFSPDGTKIAILKNTDETDKKSILYICSSEDGSVLKSYEFHASAFGIPQYLDFFEDDRLAIYTERYAFSPDYIYIVEIGS